LDSQAPADHRLNRPIAQFALDLFEAVDDIVHALLVGAPDDAPPLGNVVDRLELVLKAAAVSAGLDHDERRRIPFGRCLDKCGETARIFIAHAASAQFVGDPLRQSVGRLGIGGNLDDLHGLPSFQRTMLRPRNSVDYRGDDCGGGVIGTARHATAQLAT
jgi:hypothetical protein